MGSRRLAARKGRYLRGTRNHNNECWSWSWSWSCALNRCGVSCCLVALLWASLRFAFPSLHSCLALLCLDAGACARTRARSRTRWDAASSFSGSNAVHRPLFFQHSSSCFSSGSNCTPHCISTYCSGCAAPVPVQARGGTSRMAAQTWVAVDGRTDPGSSVASAVAALVPLGSCASRFSWQPGRHGTWD